MDHSLVEPKRIVRVLLICTRDPRGQATGRKLVLRTIIDSLAALDCDVTIAHFGAPMSDDDSGQAGFFTLHKPRRHELCASIVSWVLHRRPSLNEALYTSRRAREQIAEIISAKRPDVVITDMVRTAAYGRESGLPWIADLDDLLSRRYALAANWSNSGNLLGYYPSTVLRILWRLASPLNRSLLEREARVIAARELEVAREAAVVTLVSASEAQDLAARSQCDVACMPMAIRGPEHLPSEEPTRDGLVFLGGLDYLPNMRAVRQYDTMIAPSLRAAGLDTRLHIIGAAGARERKGLSDAIVFRGYVDDLDSSLRTYEAMLVPKVAPGGVKTKIIHAALNGLVVLAHESAVEGSDLAGGREVLVWRNAEDLAGLLRELREGSIDRLALRRNAQDWAKRNFDPAILREKWARHIQTCLEAGPEARPAPQSSAAVAESLGPVHSMQQQAR